MNKEAAAKLPLFTLSAKSLELSTKCKMQLAADFPASKQVSAFEYYELLHSRAARCDAPAFCKS
jgi:hypothetical protein